MKKKNQRRKTENSEDKNFISHCKIIFKLFFIRDIEGMDIQGLLKQNLTHVKLHKKKLTKVRFWLLNRHDNTALPINTFVRIIRITVDVRLTLNYQVFTFCFLETKLQ
jgi:hypothetical protein